MSLHSLARGKVTIFVANVQGWRGGSGGEGRGTGFEVRGARVEGRGTGDEVRGARVEVRGSRGEGRGSRVEVRGSRFEGRGARCCLCGISRNLCDSRMGCLLVSELEVDEGGDVFAGKFEYELDYDEKYDQLGYPPRFYK